MSELNIKSEGHGPFSSQNELLAAKGRAILSAMSEGEMVKKILTPFLTHGICKDEAEALRMLATDYVQRQIKRYDERATHFRSFYAASAEQFADQVKALCQSRSPIPVLRHLDRPEQVMQAEDDLEEWQAAEQFLGRWEAVQSDLRHAAAA